MIAIDQFLGLIIYLPLGPIITRRMENRTPEIFFKLVVQSGHNVFPHRHITKQPNILKRPRDAVLGDAGGSLAADLVEAPIMTDGNRAAGGW